MNYNVEKLIEEGRAALEKNPRRYPNASGLQALIEGSPDLYDVLLRSFYMGAAIGNRIARKQKKG